MTNRTIYGITWTPGDDRNILRLAAWFDGLPSQRPHLGIDGKPLLSPSKPSAKPLEYLPSGGIDPELLEARGWSGRDSLFGTLTKTDVHGVTWDATPAVTGKRSRVEFSFRLPDNPYKRSPLMKLERKAYFALFDGYGSVPPPLLSKLVQLGYISDSYSTPQAGRC